MTDQTTNHSADNNILAAWMTFFRGLFAVALGIALMVRPDVARPFWSNFLGAFWFSGGMLNIRWGLRTKHSKLITILVGIVGIFAGAAVVGRQLAARWIEPDFIVSTLGIVALLTGLLHATGRMTVRHAPVGELSRTGVLLGIVEIILGLTLLFGSYVGPLAYTISIVWALLGGIALMNDARLMREEALLAAVHNHNGKFVGFSVKDGGQMNMFKRVVGWILVAVSVLGIVLSLGGLVGSWIVRNKATAVTVNLLTVGETAVSSFSDGLNRIDNRLDLSQENIATLESDIVTAGEDLSETSIVGTVIANNISEETATTLVEAKTTAVTIADTAAALNEAIKAANEIPFVTLDGFAPTLIGDVADGLTQLESDMAAFRTGVQERREERVSTSVDFFTGLTTGMSARIGGVQTSLNEADGRLQTTSANLADAKVTLPRIFTAITLLVSVMIIFAGLAFASLLLHSWQLARNPELTLGELINGGKTAV